MPPTCPPPLRRRTRRARPGLLASVVLLAVACASGGIATTAGATARPLVPLAGGSETTLASFKGKPLVVNLWASWCTPCRAEMPAFEAVHRQMGDKVAFVGVTDDPDKESAAAAAAQAKVTYTLLFDTTGRLQTDFGVAALPATIFIDADGQVTSQHAGALSQATLTDTIGQVYGIH